MSNKVKLLKDVYYENLKELHSFLIEEYPTLGDLPETSYDFETALKNFFKDNNVWCETDYYLDDFTLTFKNGDDYDDCMVENAKILYENLKGLPRYILFDNKFWTWLCINQLYDANLKACLDKKSSKSGKTSENFFNESWGIGNKARSLLRGYISRLFFTAYNLYDESFDDPYELVEFALAKNKGDRYRYLCWRHNLLLYNDAQKGIVLGEKMFVDSGNEFTTGKFYNAMVADIMAYLSCKDPGALTKEDYAEMVLTYLNESKEQNPEKFNTISN